MRVVGMELVLTTVSQNIKNISCVISQERTDTSEKNFGNSIFYPTLIAHYERV
jgi:hypothetical protein